MKKANIMKTAHKIAKAILVRVRDYSIALSFALKLVWDDLDKAWTPRAIQDFLDDSLKAFNAGVDRSNNVETVDGDFENAKIPAWIISKNLTFEEQSAIKETSQPSITAGSVFSSLLLQAVRLSIVINAMNSTAIFLI